MKIVRAADRRPLRCPWNAELCDLPIGARYGAHEIPNYVTYRSETATRPMKCRTMWPT